MIYQLAITLALCFVSIEGLFAQSPSSVITNYFTQVREGRNPATPRSLWQEHGQHTEVLTALSPYYADTLATVRGKAYYIAQQVGLHSQDQKVRQQVVGQLVAAVQDADSGNSGRASSFLTEFQPDDFTTRSRQQLAGLLSEQPPHFHRILRLIGYVGMQDQVPALKNLLASLSARDRWSAQLALARLGDQEALATVLARAKRYPVDDDVVYELLPDLVYTRQKAAVDYLVTVVQSNDKNCASADPEADENIVCGYRVLELLAPVIRSFPLSVDESGDLAVSSYPTALQQARQWFKQHPDYLIAGDQF